MLLVSVPTNFVFQLATRSRNTSFPALTLPVSVRARYFDALANVGCFRRPDILASQSHIHTARTMISAEDV